MKFYLIHGIDSSRKPFMEDQFKRHGIPAEDVTWITYPNKQDYLLEDICVHPTLTKGQIACTYKHYLALHDIVNAEYELAVIMEDNIEFIGDVPSAIERYLKDLPENWDILFDSDFLNLTDSGPLYGCVQKTGKSKGANFLLVNRKSAKLLYDSFLPFNNCSDHHYNDLFYKLNMNVYWANTPNVHKLMRPSTWKDEPKKKTFIWLNANSS
jgi:GR25 family glycosyltransferase involved in LPS biosynthesis